MLRFVKMQGAGNDYVFVDCRAQQVPEPAALARAISDRHRGVGSDGLVLLLPSTAADLAMRIFNADGSEAELCGNAARCAAFYAWRQRWVTHSPLLLETAAGPRRLWQNADGSITAEMGVPTFPAEEIFYRGQPLTPVSVGNPHAVLFVPDAAAFPLAEMAAIARRESCNVEIAQVCAPLRLCVRVWERGSGETMACGTGACAAAAAAIRQGVCRRDTDIAVVMPGGVLTVRQQIDGALLLRGEAVISFWGEWDD